MVTEVKPLQPLKTEEAIAVTEFGIDIEVNPLHFEKAVLPIVVTEFGMVIEVNPLQP